MKNLKLEKKYVLPIYFGQNNIYSLITTQPGASKRLKPRFPKLPVLSDCVTELCWLDWQSVKRDCLVVDPSFSHSFYCLDPVKKPDNNPSHFQNSPIAYLPSQSKQILTCKSCKVCSLPATSLPLSFATLF